MLGILLILAISWLLLYLFEKESILALGFLPAGRRALQFLLGFLFSAVLCVMVQFTEAGLEASKWMLNDDFSYDMLFSSLWWDVRSVLTEELIFRGALLFILIRKIGVGKSIWTSAVAFGIYHWFSFGVFGSLVPMVLIFIGTGLMGYAWALAFTRTGSILLPFGLHLGWNFTYNSIFSNGPLGELVFVSQGGVELTGGMSLLNFFIGWMLVPLITIVCIRYFVKDEHKFVQV